MSEGGRRVGEVRRRMVRCTAKSKVQADAGGKRTRETVELGALAGRERSASRRTVRPGLLSSESMVEVDVAGGLAPLLVLVADVPEECV